MKVTLPKTTPANIDSIINRLFTRIMAPDLKPLAEVATHRPCVKSRLERSPKTDKLFFKAADGTEIPVDRPDAQKLLRDANNRYWDAVRIQKTTTPDLPLNPKKIF